MSIAMRIGMQAEQSMLHRPHVALFMVLTMTVGSVTFWLDSLLMAGLTWVGHKSFDRVLRTPPSQQMVMLFQVHNWVLCMPASSGNLYW